MNKPLISVIIPAYNAELFINRAIGSIVRQSYKNLDIVIIDDGSTDSTRKLCQEWVNFDSRVRYIYQENTGVSGARNRGLEEARGDYISFLDADDELEESAIEILHNLVVDYDAQMGAVRWRNVYKSHGKIETSEGANKVFSRKEAIISSLKGKELSCSITGKLFEKGLFTDIRFPLGMTIEDAYVIMELTLLCERVAYSDKRLYIYHHREGSIMHSGFSDDDLNVIKAHQHNKEVILAVYPELSLLVEQRLAWAYLYVYDKLILSFSDDKELEKELRKEILDRTGVILKEDYFNRGRKLAVLLLHLSRGIYKQLAEYRSNKYVVESMES